MSSGRPLQRPQRTRRKKQTNKRKRSFPPNTEFSILKDKGRQYCFCCCCDRFRRIPSFRFCLSFTPIFVNRFKYNYLKRTWDVITSDGCCCDHFHRIPSFRFCLSFTTIFVNRFNNIFFNDMGRQYFGPSHRSIIFLQTTRRNVVAVDVVVARFIFFWWFPRKLGNGVR